MALEQPIRLGEINEIDTPRVGQKSAFHRRVGFSFWLSCDPSAYAKSWQRAGCKNREIDAALRDQTTKLGAPKIDGKNAVGGRDAPALYFGSTKMNNNFSVVDAVAEEGGRGTGATLFVKSSYDYIRVATNVSKRMGSGRGLGTVLTGAPLEAIKASNTYYGKASILGTPYISGYEPIKDASGATIGVYFVGYTK